MKNQEAERARELEKKILGLPLMTGILFVGVSVELLEPGKTATPVYCFWIGCHRDFEEQTAIDLVRHTLQEELKEGLIIRIQVHRGIGRSYLEKY